MRIQSTLIVLLLVAWMPFRPALALEVAAEGGMQAPRKTRPALTDAQREQMWSEIHSNRASLRAVGILPDLKQRAMSFVAPPSLDPPLAPAAGYTEPGFFGISGFVDHDPAYPDQLEDYDCGWRTYDLADGYGHAGTDYYLWPFWWELMDSDSVEIVAAAAGIIVWKNDGEYDRNCDWDNIIGDGWNAVYVEHADGSVAWYGHMKSGSVTAKPVGASVSQGEKLGAVGSSGFSDGPHLHFELYNSNDNLVDPYVGACNPTTVTSWWANQPPYYVSEINRLMTASGVPGGPTWPDEDYCANFPDRAKDVFRPNAPIYFNAFYRDELPGHASVFTVYRPDNSVFASFNHTATAPYYYGATYFSLSDTIPNDPQLGTWRVEVTYQSVLYSHEFEVVPEIAVPALGAASRIVLIALLIALPTTLWFGQSATRRRRTH
jgi:hypothetical protein